MRCCNYQQASSRREKLGSGDQMGEREIDKEIEREANGRGYVRVVFAGCIRREEVHLCHLFPRRCLPTHACCSKCPCLASKHAPSWLGSKGATASKSPAGSRTARLGCKHTSPGSSTATESWFSCRNGRGGVLGRGGGAATNRQRWYVVRGRMAGLSVLFTHTRNATPRIENALERDRASNKPTTTASATRHKPSARCA